MIPLNRATLTRCSIAGAGLFLVLGAGWSTRADFPSLVLDDKPALYFRLSESIANPSYSYATNQGSTGTSSQGTYNGLEQTMKQQPGAMAGDPAARFDGSSQYVLIPTAAPVNVGPPFTIEAWVKPASIRASGSLVCPVGSLYRNTTAPNTDAKGWVFYQDADGWNYRQGDSTGYRINIKAGGAPDTNTWYHLVVTFDGTTATLYVNGALGTSGSNSAYQPNTDVPMGIGARGDASFQFPGSVDEVAIYPSVLSASTIAAHHDAATTNAAAYSGLVLALNPVGYWRLDEPVHVYPKAANSGTLGSVADGGYHGNAVSTAGPQPPTFPGLESANSAVALDGTNGVVRIPELGTLSDPALTNVSEATFMCWVKPNGSQGSGSYKGLFAMRPLSIGLYLSSDTLNYSWNDANNTWGFNSGLTPPAGEWALATVVVRPDSATFYLQSVSGGFQTAVNTVTHSPANFTTGPFAIGNDINFGGTTRYFNGSIDEAAMFTKALGEGHIRTWFLAGAGINDVAPVLITDPPVLSPQGTIYSTTTFSLSVDAYGSVPLTYQWRKDGQNLSGATASTYSKSNAVLGDAGNYDVVLVNGAGSITSSIVNVAINSAVPPTIDQQPFSETRYLGARAVFTVGVSGTTPFLYQWKYNGTAIANATNSSLVIAPVASTDVGQYSVVISNVAGFAASSTATLTVKTPTPGSYEAAVVGLGPVAYWRFNEANGSVIAYDYVNGYNATNSSTVVGGVPGPRPPTFPGLEADNTAYEYDGTDTETTTGVSLVNNRSQFTILGWFRPTATQIAANGRVGLFGQNDIAEFGFHGLGTIGIWTPYAFAQASSSLVQTGQWYFITATADGTGQNLYLNGRPIAQAAGATANYGSSAYPFNIGYAVLDATGNYFLGDIDEVAFFERALSLKEIFDVNSKATGIQLKLAMAPSHDVVNDTKPSGTPHDGFDNGAVWVATNSDATPVTRTGLMQFNPTNGPTQVVIPFNADFNSPEGTMTFWMRSAGNTDTNGNDAAMLIDRRTSIGDVIVLNDDGTLFWQPNWNYGQSTARTVNDDLWHHVAYVYDQVSTISMYIDGVLDTSHTDANTWSWPVNQIELGLSHDPYWRAYDGYLDDFRIYSRQLTDTEIAQIYAGDSAALVGAANLVGRYNFDGPPGSLRLTLTWTLGTLQSANSILGPWSDVTGATSPYYVMRPDGTKFYRLKL